MLCTYFFQGIIAFKLFNSNTLNIGSDKISSGGNFPLFNSSKVAQCLRSKSSFSESSDSFMMLHSSLCSVITLGTILICNQPKRHQKMVKRKDHLVTHFSQKGRVITCNTGFFFFIIGISLGTKVAGFTPTAS